MRSALPRRGRCLVLLVIAAAAAALADPGPPIEIRRATSPIVIDGDLSDAAWREAVPVDSWLETNPGDNIAPKVGNRAYLAYDEQFFYAAFEFEDPEPGAIRAPLGDRDNVPSYTDYGGVIVDSTNDGKSAQMFLANPRGIQYDAMSSDASGEDSSPDFFWESAGRIGERGWTLEMKIPFSSLRYTEPNPERWGILLYRNRPREFRYQMFTSPLPRSSTCFICNVRPLVGLRDLPAGAHWVVAPYVTANQNAAPRDGLGSPLATDDAEGDGGVDAKWIPNPNTVIDATVNPDFSQIEADAPQIAANERFALFYPEKRPFFLESVNLLSTPVDAVYTRTFTSPKYGLRATGGNERTRYTVFVGEDRGGGSVILPGPEGSDFAAQDFTSRVAVGRLRHDFGKSFASFLYTGRENEDGSYNRVAGPDFQWRPTASDTLTGQLLYSWSETPDRPDLAAQWDGRRLTGHDLQLWWNRQTETWDFFLRGDDVAEGFRADNGFVPQVGFRGAVGEIGRSFHPVDRPVSRLRLFTYGSYQEDRDGELLFQEIVPGFGLDTLLNSFVRLEVGFDEVASGGERFRRVQLRPILEIRPGGWFSQLLLDGNWGDQVDFANLRPATGWTANLQIDLRPTDHLQLQLAGSRRILDVAVGGADRRLLTAEVARLRGVYTFSAKSWFRLIGQWVETRRDPALYAEEVEARSGDFAGSAVFAYKLNWQTVLFLGYGDERELDAIEELQPASRELFLKVSYAFQR